MSTRAQLRARVRLNLGEPVPGSSPRFSDTSINNHINEAFGQYQLELFANAEGDFLTRSYISLVAGQDLYPLPMTWVKTKKIWNVESEGKYEVQYSERRDWPVYNNDSLARSNPFTHRFMDRNILLEPPPQISKTNALLHEYYALQTELTADDQSPPAGFIEPWQTMLVLYATIAELEGKEAVGSVVSIDTFRGRLEKAEDRFRRIMGRRTEAHDYVMPDDL